MRDPPLGGRGERVTMWDEAGGEGWCTVAVWEETCGGGWGRV